MQACGGGGGGMLGYIIDNISDTKGHYLEQDFYNGVNLSEVNLIDT